jgi:integrase
VGVVGRNVAALVDLPRSREVYEAQLMTVEEARRFLVAARGHRLEALYVVGLALGPRQAEIPGLTWGDVGLEGEMLAQQRHPRSNVIQGQPLHLGPKRPVLFAEMRKLGRVQRTATSSQARTSAASALHSSSTRVKPWAS